MKSNLDKLFKLSKGLRNNIGIVEVMSGNACGGCFSIIRLAEYQDILKGKIIICENCGRMLVKEQK